MTDLTDWGVEKERPPLVERKSMHTSPTTGKIAGFTGRELRRDTVVYTTRRGKKHFYREGDGFAISDTILARLQAIKACSLILVHDWKNDVYEFRKTQYLHDGRAVHERDLEDPDDPQTYVPIGEAKRVWEDHADTMFEREFEDAVAYVKGRKRR